MNRAGVVYRQVVNDLCDLMAERASLKNSLKLELTTISARDNNPLKWAPARQVAVDLLRESDTGFLKGADAFRASFEDLREHGACLLAGSRAAIAGVLDDLKPERIEAAQKKQPLAFLSRFEAAWRLFQECHAALVEEVNTPASGRIERAFRKGYQTHADMLDKESEAA
jgi:type VI secretion system protein ImpI